MMLGNFRAAGGSSLSRTCSRVIFSAAFKDPNHRDACGTAEEVSLGARGTTAPKRATVMKLLWPAWTLPCPVPTTAKRPSSPLTEGTLVSHTSSCPSPFVLINLPTGEAAQQPVVCQIEKCEFHVPKVNFLGFVIAQGQLNFLIGRTTGTSNIYDWHGY